MGSEYDPSKPTRYLQYLDANNLYGLAMSQPLPTRGFHWVDVHPDEIEELVNRNDKGYLLEVDIAYPRELHDYHNDLPFYAWKNEHHWSGEISSQSILQEAIRNPH